MENLKNRRIKCQGFDFAVIVDSIWFPLNTYNYLDRGELTTIGIVKILDKLTNQTKCYIGAAKGEDIVEDENFVVACGSPIHENNCFSELYTLMKLKKEK